MTAIKATLMPIGHVVASRLVANTQSETIMTSANISRLARQAAMSLPPGRCFQVSWFRGEMQDVRPSQVNQAFFEPGGGGVPGMRWIVVDENDSSDLLRLRFLDHELGVQQTSVDGDFQRQGAIRFLPLAAAERLPERKVQVGGNRAGRRGDFVG